jgi:hypothetical protein
MSTLISIILCRRRCNKEGETRSRRERGKAAMSEWSNANSAGKEKGEERENWISGTRPDIKKYIYSGHLTNKRDTPNTDSV